MDEYSALYLAARPKALTIAIIPVVIGTLLARSSGVLIDWEIAFFALLTSLVLQIGTHFVNDACDFQRGVDTPARLGSARAAQSGLISASRLYLWGLGMFALTTLFGIPLVIKGGGVIALLLALSILAGYCYTGGPKPFAYQGWGELVAFIFFGLAATGASYYLQAGKIELHALLAGTQIGLLETAILAINNCRDYATDKQAGKRTLAVIWGIKFAKYEISCLLLLPFVLSVGWFYTSYFFAAILPCAIIGLAFRVTKEIWKHEPGPYYQQLFALGGALYLVFGTLLAIGIWLQ